MNSIQKLLIAAGSVLLGTSATAQRNDETPTLRQFSEQRRFSAGVRFGQLLHLQKPGRQTGEISALCQQFPLWINS